MFLPECGSVAMGSTAVKILAMTRDKTLAFFRGVAAIALFSAAGLSFSAVHAPPLVDALHWETRAFSGIAPPPFGRVRFEIDAVNREEVSEIRISVSGRWLTIEPEIFSGLTFVEHVGFFSNSEKQTPSESAESIDFAFETGKHYEIDVRDYTCECDDSCKTWVRDVVRIRVHADFRVEKIRMRYEDMNLCP